MEGNIEIEKYHLTIPGGSVIRHLPVMQETQVQSLCREDPLEEEMTNHSSILAWEVTWIEEPGGIQPMGVTKQSDIT